MRKTMERTISSLTLPGACTYWLQGKGMYSEDMQPVDKAVLRTAFHALAGAAMAYLLPAITGKQGLDASHKMLQEKAGKAGMEQLQAILADAGHAASARITTDTRIRALASVVSEISDAATKIQSSKCR